MRPSAAASRPLRANFGAHPETVGLKTDDNPGDVSADFVYYTEQVINKAGYNFMYFQGAIGSLIPPTDFSNDGLRTAMKDGQIRDSYCILGMTLLRRSAELKSPTPVESEGMSQSDSYTLWYEGWHP